MQVINLELMSHPLNWATIFFMLLILAFGGHLLLSLAGIEPAS